MKKKFLAIMTAVILVLTCAFVFVACGNDIDGTYYVYENGEKQEGASMTLDDGKVTLKQDLTGNGTIMGFDGTYTVDGDTIKVTVSFMGVSVTQEMTVVSDGIIKDKDGTYYCKEGKTPPTDEEVED